MNRKFFSKFLSDRKSGFLALGLLAAVIILPFHALADNPIVSHVYTADPAARVFNGRVYVVVTHDQDNQSDYGELVDYFLFSSEDMVNWQDHGIIWNSRTDTNWANLAYAPDFVERNGKYYLYFPDGAGSIGVAVADKPEGPYKDPLGHPLVDRSISNANVDWLFDPGVFVDDDGQAYLYFGGGGPGNARVIGLNSDMISTSGEAITLDVPYFFEALYMHKHNGTYYLSYSTNPENGMRIDYMTSTNPVSGFSYRGTILSNPWENNYNNNHASIVAYNNQSYIFYHNRAVANERGASTYQRSINVDNLYYNDDGSIMQVNAGPTGVSQVKRVDAFAVNQAEMFDNEQGIETEDASEGTRNIMMDGGDWVKISGVDFGPGATGIDARVAASGGADLEIHLDDINNQPVATLQVTDTGGLQNWQTQSASFADVTGVHDVFLQATAGLNLNWYQFTGYSGDSGDSGDSLVIELETLAGQNLFSPLSVQDDASASNGQYVEWSNDGTHQILSSPTDTAGGQMQIPFNLSQSADVQFQIQVSMAGGKDDSFFYKLDDGGWNTQNNSSTSGWGTLLPATFNNLAAGDHVLSILRREDGAKLDRITLTASAGSVSGSGSSDVGAANAIVVRMRGVIGDERVSLQVNGATIQTWTLAATMRDYSVATDEMGEIRVAFTNDNGDRDVQVDSITVNGRVRQAEDQDDNTGAWGNQGCGDGTLSEWLHCNGSIGFGPVSDDGSPPESDDEQAFIVAINAGGQAATYSGLNYQADQYFNGGSVHSTTDPISGTTEATVFQSERYGSYSYEIPVTTGTYAIDMQFAEIYHNSAGQRLFNLYVEGRPELSNVDLFTLAGHDNAYTYKVSGVLVTDGSLSIRLETLTDNGTIAGFAVFSPDGALDDTEPEPEPEPEPGPEPAGFFVGNITTSGNVRSDFIQYWDQITPENEGKWGSVEATRDVYNWSGVDRAYNYAKQHNIPFKQHTFVWGNQYPGWIDSLSPSEQAAEIEEWIRDFCARYPDTDMIDVVNEATPGHAPASYAQSAFGDDWIIRTFQLARQYCPNSTLILNDYNVLSWNTSEFINMARPAVNAGVVDALGLQSHGLADWSLSDIENKLNQVAALGLPLYISEYDIQKTNDQEQLQVMQSQFPLFFNHPSIEGITFWGYVVGSTWQDGTGLIYADGTPRPAMTWLLNYLGR